MLPVPEPEILSFVASPNPVSRGQPTTVTAHFSGGSATVDGIADDMVSLVGYQITRFHQGSFTYTLVVTNLDGVTSSATLTLVVT